MKDRALALPGFPEDVAGERVLHSPPHLPTERGPISFGLLELFAKGNIHRRDPELRALAQLASSCDPFSEDAQLALTICYELHYQGFRGVDERWEWYPELLWLRAALEERFLTSLRTRIRLTDPLAALEELCSAPADEGSVGHFLRDDGTWEQIREFFIQRSIYHLKEADPHAWVIPRLTGRPKAAIVAVEFDEYGGGSAARMHSRLFRNLLEAAGLNPRYLGYLDSVPSETLATVNLMSLCGLHRARRGALVGLFAAAEITTGPSAKVMVDALNRLSAPETCMHFYREHIEADAVHEQLLRKDVVEELLRSEPDLAEDVSFGIHASALLEERFADRLLTSWAAGESSLRSV
ncbi:iron-containing redox enzyme family protein [Hoyosella subflava]|uniref:Iron-containing redox enzyme family protein n=1 Tax=Hoyosella subflava (strain DSM 45089 / JCM 17490 / NBRC 109087 / DQS3-9A1) TaxID=443218 RepID=F6EGC2_HOYSD|nr:iron-containing redox enzyme family protein [Hoyosella subflava]AEF39847.1 hypothetical protein AS9A_1395 [Hoyosella subflava DQS3-9A1]